MSFTVLEPSSVNSTATFSFASVTVTGNLNLTGSNINSNLGNSATANYFIGNGSLLTGLPASYSNTNVASYLPTYTGNLVALTGEVTTTANVTANYFIGNGSQLTGLPASYSNTNVASYLPTYTGNVSANYFIGNGSTLTNVTGANITGNAPFAGTSNYANTANSVSGSNVSGNVNYAITSNYANTANSVSGSNVSGQVGNALIAGTVYTNAQPNITSVGTLSGITVSGNAIISGNLTVSGTTDYVNVTNLYVQDPIIDLGGGANNTPLTTNDGKDRGTLLHYYTTETVDAFMGWDNSNSEFGFGSNVSVSSEVVTWNSYGNVRAGYFIGNGSQLTGLPASYSNTNVAAYLPTYTGNLVALTGAVTTTANVTANYFIGNGSTLTNITGANVTGYVANATNANTVTTAAQPNITSVGSLSALTVTGLITATGTGIKTSNVQDSSGTVTLVTKYNNNSGDVGVYGNIVAGTNGTGNVTATYFIGNGSQLTGLPASYSNTNVAAYLPTYTGNLVALTGAVTTTANVTANYFIGNGSQLTGITTSYSNTNVAAYLPTYTGNFTAGNVNASGNVSGTYILGNASYMTGLTASPAGSNQQVQFNDGGALGASVNFTFNKATGLLTVGSASGGSMSGANSITANYFTGTLTTAAQPNITSVGTLTSLTVNGNISGNVLGNPVGFRNVPPVGTKTSSYILATGDVGKYVQIGSGGSITIPNSTFSEGDAVGLFNNTSGNVTITCSTASTYISGTDTVKSTMTLATRGVATVFFISSTVAVVSGSVS